MVQGTYSTATTIASETYTDTGLSQAITPTANTSKILVMINQPFFIQRSSSPLAAGAIRLLRGSTTIHDPNGSAAQATFWIEPSSGGTYGSTLATIIYLDSPATTSSTTYKTQARAALTSSGGEVQVQRSSAVSTITLLEIGA